MPSRSPKSRRLFGSAPYASSPSPSRGSPAALVTADGAAVAIDARVRYPLVPLKKADLHRMLPRISFCIALRVKTFYVECNGGWQLPGGDREFILRHQRHFAKTTVPPDTLTLTEIGLSEALST